MSTNRWNGDPQTAPEPDEGFLVSFDPSHGPDCVACQRRDTHEMGAFGAVPRRHPDEHTRRYGMTDLVEVGDQLVHPQRVSAVTCIRTGKRPDDVDDDGVGWEPGTEWVVDGIGGGAYKEIPRKDRVDPPYWIVQVLLAGGGSVVVSRVYADNWDAAHVDRMHGEALVIRDRVARDLGLVGPGTAT
jgi:hypothetical protein